MNKFKIILPWPDEDLSPNARVHWSVKSTAVASAKEGAMWLTKASDRVTLRGDLCAVWTFHPPKIKRKRDQDNVLSSMKAWQDGVCKELGLDDVRIKDNRLRWGDSIAFGEVVLVLYESGTKKGHNNDAREMLDHAYWCKFTHDIGIECDCPYELMLDLLLR